MGEQNNMKAMSLPELAEIICNGTTRGRHGASYLFNNALREGRDPDEKHEEKSAIDVFRVPVWHSEESCCAFYELVRFGATLSRNDLSLIGKDISGDMKPQDLWMISASWTGRTERVGRDDIVYATTPLHLGVEHNASGTIWRTMSMITSISDMYSTPRKTWRKWLDTARSEDGATGLDMLLESLAKMTTEDLGKGDPQITEMRAILAGHLEGETSFLSGNAFSRLIPEVRERLLMIGGGGYLRDGARQKIESALDTIQMETRTALAPKTTRGPGRL